MIRRAKRAAIFASPFVAVGLWAGYVLKERRKAPDEVRFSIGSAGVSVLVCRVRCGCAWLSRGASQVGCRQ